jgi:hypothetical protein
MDNGLLYRAPLVVIFDKYSSKCHPQKQTQVNIDDITCEDA